MAKSSGGGKGQKGASLRPSDFKGGGLVDDVSCRWTNVRFTDEPPEGYKNAGLGLMIDLEMGDGTVVPDNWWSAGSLEFFEPSKDGKRAIPVGDKTDMSPSTNFALLLNSLLEAGFDEDDLDDDISALNGLEVHMVRKPQPERKGLMRNRERDDDDDRGPRTVLLVSELLKLPGEKGTKLGKGGGSKAGAKAKTNGREDTRRARDDDEDEDEDTRPVRGRGRGEDDDEDEGRSRPRHGRGGERDGSGAKASARSRRDQDDDQDDDEGEAEGGPEPDLDTDLAELVREALDDAGEAIDKTDLVQRIHKATLKDKRARDMVKRVYDDGFLEWGQKKKYWTFDGKAETVEAR